MNDQHKARLNNAINLLTEATGIIQEVLRALEVVPEPDEELEGQINTLWETITSIENAECELSNLIGDE